MDNSSLSGSESFNLLKGASQVNLIKFRKLCEARVDQKVRDIESCVTSADLFRAQGAILELKNILKDMNYLIKS